MAFPSYSSRVTTAFSSAATSHLCLMPDSVESGALLIIVWCNAANLPPTVPTGWTQIASENQNVTRFRVFAKVADGTEASTTVDVVTGSAVTGACIAIRISDWEGTLGGGVFVASADDAGTTPNPPSLTPLPGAADQLWLAVSGASDDDASYDSAPTNFVDLTSVVSGGGTNNGASCGMALRAVNRITLNPSSFTISESENWGAATIAVYPAAAGGILIPIFNKHYRNQGMM